jgi:hypothetical protein
VKRETANVKRFPKFGMLDCFRQSAIGNRQSAIGNRQSAIGNRQSAIGNRQSAINFLPRKIVD